MYSPMEHKQFEYRTGFFSLPFEILDTVAFELAATRPLGPPSSVLPLLLTCSPVYRRLSPTQNPHLWSRIFCYRFDSSAVKRRAFEPTDTQYLEQLQAYCVAMQRLKAGNIFFGSLVTDNLEDIGLEEALMTSIIMMLEDDGRNSRHLLEWAKADRAVSHIVRKRLYEGSDENNGWPLENKRNACALTLMWLLTAEENLYQESPQERAQIMSAIFPFIAVPFRYATSEAPPNFASLPFFPRAATTTTPTSLQTAHGPYPVFPPSQRISIEPHYGSRPSVSIPLVAPAAKLLYFARAEIARIGTPSHMAANREAWFARGNGLADIPAPTLEDIDEFNWGWKARPPLGLGRPVTRRHVSNSPVPIGSPGWSWGVGDSKPFGSFLEEDDLTVGEDASAPPSANPRWCGKAPHSIPSTIWPKSRKWDADWWRLRLCNDPFVARTRIPYGPVFEMGSLDGLWQGYYMVPDEGRLSTVLSDPQLPQIPLDQALRTTIMPLYLRLREAHSLRSRTSAGNDADNDVYGNMNNAWYNGDPGTTGFQVLDARDEDGTRLVEIHADEKLERCVCWKRGADEMDRGLGLGNDAYQKSGVHKTSTGSRFDPWLDGEGSGGWPGYPHDRTQCEECTARIEMQERIERERVFASVGLGINGGTGPDPEESIELSDEEDDQPDELEPGEPGFIDEEGNEYPPISPSIDRSKLATSRCSGVREVYCFGESDPRHGDAWGHYRFYGRVRSWDGLVAILRCPVGQGEDTGMILLYGYIFGGDTFTGNWRSIGVHEAMPGWEGPFVMSRRED